MTDAPALDLSGAIPLTSFVLDLVIPGTAKPSGWKVELAGPMHPQTIEVNNIIAREALAKESAIEFAQVNNRKYKVDEEPVDVRRRKNVNRVCRRIVGWTPAPTFRNVGPDPISFSVDAATDLFLRQDMAGFFVQITDYFNGERAFMPPSDPI